MKPFWNIVLVFLFAFGVVYAEDKVEHDRSRLALFLQPSVSFLNFEQREYFQDAIDTIYYSFKEDALTETDSLNVAKQDFQKVNFCFPISAGLQYQIFDDQFISAGIGFIYDNESVVLTDRKGKTHNYSYTIQGVPLFLEYRLGIPRNLMSLSGESLFSISLRWYWVLPGTEIYSTWGKIEAKTPVTGAGFGIGLGYLIASWKGINIFGDIGFNSISVESNRSFADIVPDAPTEKAKWNIGGLLMQIRVSFGVWNKPAPVEDEDEDRSSTTTADTTAQIPQPAVDSIPEASENNTPKEQAPQQEVKQEIEPETEKESEISPTTEAPPAEEK